MIAKYRTPLLFFCLMTVLLGMVYPAFVWFTGQVFFSNQANGSLIVRKGEIVGSALIGQNFTENKYFWPRPSETPQKPYHAALSGSANLNPSHPDLKSRVLEIRHHFSHAPLLPADMVTASASGLDPYISLDSALLQAPRVAKARNISVEQVRILIKTQIEKSGIDPDDTGLVNVVLLNDYFDSGFGGTR